MLGDQLVRWAIGERVNRVDAELDRAGRAVVGDGHAQGAQNFAEAAHVGDIGRALDPGRASGKQRRCQAGHRRVLGAADFD